MYTSFEELPIMLTVMDIANILGISRNNAYALSNSEDFPAMRIGKRVVISKDRFYEWIMQTKSVEI